VSEHPDPLTIEESARVMRCRLLAERKEDLSEAIAGDAIVCAKLQRTPCPIKLARRQAELETIIAQLAREGWGLEGPLD
jgi:hypothetical protein